MVRFLGTDKPAELIRQPAAQRGLLARPGAGSPARLGLGRPGGRPGRDAAAALDSGLPTVVDADGLPSYPSAARTPGCSPRTPASWPSLLGEERSWVTEDPVRAVRAGVEKTGATVLLKGASQLVAGPDDDTSIRMALPGPAWTGQAGSGDVLGGICAALAGGWAAAREAAVTAASVQAYTARRHPGPVPPQRAG